MADRSASNVDPIGVLICDDIRSIRLLLRVTIELRDGSDGKTALHVVGEATDGDEAVSEAERLQPNVILLDLSMPHRTGLDALPDIKRVAPGAKIIVVSGFSASMMADDALARGADRYLEKGSDPDVIADAIADVATSAVNGHSAHTSAAVGSQGLNVKLRQLAQHVVDTGEVPSTSDEVV